MSKLHDIKRRIHSIKSLAKVTRAMELVTHTKIGRARKGLMGSRAYHESFARLLSAIESTYDEDDDAGYFAPPAPENSGGRAAKTETENREKGTHEVIIFLSQKGFCGSFNDRLLTHIASELPGLGKARLTVVGRLAPKWNLIMHTVPGMDTTPLSVIAASDKTWQADILALKNVLVDTIYRMRASHDDSARIYFAFNRFQSILEQVPAIEQVWPPVINPALNNEEENIAYQNALMEPGQEVMMEQTLAPWIEANLIRAWWENAAGENYARLISMKSANENAGIIIDTLTLQYNKTRQLDITQELSEITSAFNVLNILKEKQEHSED
jgi:F-type H+-transporting ATPase subunit gamma